MKTIFSPIATVAILSAVGALACAGPALGQAQQATPLQKGDATADAQSTNLLVNPGLETGSGSAPDGWQIGRTVAGITYTWDTSVGYESTHSLCLTKTENRFFPIAEWRQIVAIKDGTKHMVVSAYVKAKDLGKAVLDVQFLGADGKVVSHHWAAYIGPEKTGEPPLNHNWKRYSGTVDIPDGTTQIAVAPQIYGPGTVWFDDISAIVAP